MAASVKPETLGRRAMSDRDVASRDTVYRKPPARAAKKETTSSTKKPSGGGGGGHKQHSGGGHQTLPKKAPVPTPRNTNVTLGGTPLDVGDMRGRPDPLMPPPAGPTSMPGFLPTPPPVGPGGTPLDVGNMRGMPDPMMPPPAGPSNPGPSDPGSMRSAPAPLLPPPASPTNPAQPSGAVSLTPRVPGPGRAELAGLLAGGSKKGFPPDNNPYALPGESWLDQKGDQILPEWLTRLMGRTPTQ